MELNSTLDRLEKYEPIDRELKRAKEKHPDYPKSMFRQLAIMQEEAGEVTKAVLHYHYENGTVENIREELIQTAAMCMRMLENLPADQQPSSDEEIIYGVQYNPMIHESVFGCLSLHRSRKEAEMEMEFHKHQRMKEDDYSDVERWTIYEYKLK